MRVEEKLKGVSERSEREQKRKVEDCQREHDTIIEVDANGEYERIVSPPNLRLFVILGSIVPNSTSALSIHSLPTVAVDGDKTIPHTPARIQ